MIEVGNGYEPAFYEQPFHSHFYENQLELLQNYYNRPTSYNMPIIQEVNEINTLVKPEKEQVLCSSTNPIYQNVQKKHQKKKVRQSPFS